MRIPGLKSLKLSARWLRSRFIHGALILDYHRVAEPAWDTYSLDVRPRHFAEQLEVLRKFAHPISLQELIRMLWDGNLPRRAVVLTLDDGYADNLYHAKPLLERYEIPATVFVATGYLGREFWWDELERIVLPPVRLPERLCLTVNGRTYRWGLSDAARRTPGEVVSRSRKRFLLSLYQLFLPFCEGEQKKALEQLWAWVGAETKCRPPHRALSSDEVVRLAEGGLVQVGAHTVTHPFLATLPAATQLVEIQQSKARLEEVLRQPVTSFSYPNGSLSDDTVAVVRQAGFACACGGFADITWHGSDPFQLPRLSVKNWDGATFSRWLKRWLNC